MVENLLVGFEILQNRFKGSEGKAGGLYELILLTFVHLINNFWKVDTKKEK